MIFLTLYIDLIGFSIIFPLFFFTAFAGGLSNVGNVPGFDFPAGRRAVKPQDEDQHGKSHAGSRI